MSDASPGGLAGRARTPCLGVESSGLAPRRIAAALGVTEGAVSQWMRRAREGGGPAALERRPPPGRQPKLDRDRLAELPTYLARGPEAYGFVGDVWTTHRVATVLQREFGVRYHPAHVCRLLRRLGWSPQKPLTRASQRDEAAIGAWLHDRWPALLAKPSRRAAPASLSMSRRSTSCPV